MLPGLLGTKESDILAAHRSSVTWLLNMRLAEVSKIQKELQEARIKKELEKRERYIYIIYTMQISVLISASLPKFDDIEAHC
jgi:hypothetical protein